MKNQYSKFIKYLEKQDNIFFQRCGDYVYLTDGKVALKAPGTVYNSVIRPLSGLLPEAWDDCKGRKAPFDNYIKMTNEGMDIAKACEGLNADKVIIKSRFIADLPPKGKGKGEKARLFFFDGEIIAVNEIFCEMFSDCAIAERWTGGGKWNLPLIQKNDDFMLVMFPMKVDRAIFEVWKNAEV